MKHRLWRLLTMISFFSIGSISALYAQEKKSLTLQEAISLSLTNSNELKTNQARIEEATAAVREATERRLPDVTTSGSYLRLNQPNVNLKVKPGSNGGAGGGETAKPSQAMYGMVNASLPVYAGGRIKYGIESARFLQKAAELDADNNQEEVVLNTIDAYNNLYKAKAAVALVEENLQQARERVKQFTSLEKNGMLARNDYLKAELQASNTELALLDAQNNWKLAMININLMLGLPENTELAVDSTSLTASTSLQPVEEYVQQGLQHRKDLEALSYRKKAAQIGVKATVAEKLPSVALTGGYVAMDVPSVLTVTNAMNIGVGLQYNLSSLWKNKSKVEQAKAREKQLAIGEDMLNDAIRLQVNQAYQNYLSSQKKIEVYTTAMQQATENYKIINNKYNNGLATVTDLLDADVAQMQARMNYTFAQSDAVVAYNKLLQAAGLLTNESK